MIDHELQRALDVNPSPEFLARTRLRIASEPGRTWNWSWALMAMGGAAATIVLVAVSLPPRPRSDPAAVRIPALAAHAIGGSGALVDVARPRAGRLGRSLQPGVRRDPETLARRALEPQVLISPAESRAIRAFIAGIRDGRIDPATLPPDVPPSPEITIPPIEIAPITASSNAEGVRR